MRNDTVQDYKEFLINLVKTVKIPQNLTWQKFTDYVNEEYDLTYSESKYRKDYKSYINQASEDEIEFENACDLEYNCDTSYDIETGYKSDYSDLYKDYYSQNLEDTGLDEQLQEKETLQDKTDKLIKERTKLTNARRDYNKILRSEAETELFYEMITDSLKKIEFPKIPYNPKEIKDCNDNVGLLVISDAHYGKSFTLKGIYGEMINSYSPSIFKERMWNLLTEIEKDILTMNISKLEIIDNGDCIDGVLRTGSSLRKLEVGVTDATVEYSVFIISWLTELYGRIKIPLIYSITGGNHDQLRLLSSKKDFDDENICKVIHHIISQGIELSKYKYYEEQGVKPQITITDYDYGIYRDIGGYKVLAYHGESRDLAKDLAFYENYYNIGIDMIVTGHLHSEAKETTGIASTGDRELIRVPSLCGTDDFAKKIRKNSRAGAKFFVFVNGKKEWEKTVFLN